jgi:UDP-4-amino-4,6-dideoxy-N-acetyl-beta-L-altrosamine transaminase
MNSAEHFLPYGRQQIEEDDIAAVSTALRSPFLTQGPLVERFEAAFADHVGAPFASVVSNGTAALQLAYAALGLRAGDELITTPLTFAATANAARALGAEVRFAPVEADTGNLDVEKLSPLVTKKTRGVAVVHLGGLPADLAPLRAFCDQHGLFLVEDAAHALGAEYRGQRIGGCQYSDAATFSFHPVKHLTTGEGGAVTTRKAEVKRAVDLLRQHGVERDPARLRFKKPGAWYYEVQTLGWNYRLSDVQCALGISQLTRQPKCLAQRRALVARYREQLKQRLGDLVALQAERPDRLSAYHLLMSLIDFQAAKHTRAEVMDFLRERGIGTQVHYIPTNRHPYYIDRYGQPEPEPGTESFYARELSLPLYPSLREEDVDYIVASLAAALER